MMNLSNVRGVTKINIWMNNSKSQHDHSKLNETKIKYNFGGNNERLRMIKDKQYNLILLFPY